MYCPARLRSALELTSPGDETPTPDKAVAKAMQRLVVLQNPKWDSLSSAGVAFLADLAYATERAMWDHRWVNGRNTRSLVAAFASPFRGAALDVLDDLGHHRFAIATDSIESVFRQARANVVNAAGLYYDRLGERLQATPSSLYSFDAKHRERVLRRSA